MAIWSCIWTKCPFIIDRQKPSIGLKPIHHRQALHMEQMSMALEGMKELKRDVLLSPCMSLAKEGRILS